MGTSSVSFALVFWFFVAQISCSLAEPIIHSKSSFPSNFLFGTSSSSYQFEGAFQSEGKGPSHILHPFVEWNKNKLLCYRAYSGWKQWRYRAVDQYHRYQEDIDLMTNLGVNSYRFSISWSRILPKGKLGDVNKAGIRHYNRLIDALIQKGIQPFVTLSHYDIPQELEDRYGGWLSPKIQEDFSYYADICFRYFGDRVKHWATFNEPNIVAIRGYRSGIYPPSRCSDSFGSCEAGDSETEPFVAAHNMILSHAAATSIYKTKYQVHRLKDVFCLNSVQCRISPLLRLSGNTRRFLDPIIFGKYPAEMRQILGSGLPTFSKDDLRMMRSGLDFIGINHYTSFYAKDCIFSACEQGPGVTKTEGRYLRTPSKDGVLIGEATAVDWLFVYPQGMEEIVTYIKERYNNIPMFITENVVACSLNDFKRVEYMKGYLTSLAEAIRKGADVRGYFVWSLLDNFEWLDGYTLTFGLFHVDYSTLRRIPKLSASWYKRFISKHLRMLQTQSA
nr:beta-glucosidase 46-like isoform X1 [Ipomoea batatas]